MNNEIDMPKPTENDAMALKILESDTKKHSAKKSKKKRKKAVEKPPKAIGSRRGVETLFRNSYRAHLDLISLATTKANIMISINGLILSFLFISEAFVMSAEPLLEIPTTIFLGTCFFSMAFAILSALPEHRKNTWKKEDFTEQRANLLVFEDYTDLTEDEFVPIMCQRLEDSTSIYESMIRQLYSLGSYANKRLSFLSVSYRIFLVGLGISIFSSLIVLAIVFLRDSVIPEAAAAENTPSETVTYFDRFHPAEGLFEPSGIAQLADGKMIVVEDESSNPIAIASMNDQGALKVKPPKREALLNSWQGLSSLGKLDDLEGVAVDKQGYIYATTSYSRTEKKGRTSPNREKLVRFRMDREQVTEAELVMGLKSRMMSTLPGLAESAKKQAGGLNIEGLALSRDQKQLWFGLRSPLINNQAVILALHNHAEVFDEGEMEFTEHLLDLNGAGIRSLAYFPRLNGYLIIARQEDRKKRPFELWFWTGYSQDVPVKVKVKGIKSLNRAEGITPLEFDGQGIIMIVSDEGNKRKKRPAQYTLIHYDQLSM